MPLELGMFLGAKRYGDDNQKKKRCLILDVAPFRYQQFISDLAGMDITAHQGQPRTMVSRVRDWLATVSRRTSIPSPNLVLDSFDRFIAALPNLTAQAGIDAANILFADFERLVLAWVQADHGRAA
jgi:hypothetical protein